MVGRGGSGSSPCGSNCTLYISLLVPFSHFLLQTCRITLCSHSRLRGTASVFPLPDADRLWTSGQGKTAPLLSARKLDRGWIVEGKKEQSWLFGGHMDAITWSTFQRRYFEFWAGLLAIREQKGEKGKKTLFLGDGMSALSILFLGKLEDWLFFSIKKKLISKWNWSCKYSNKQQGRGCWKKRLL